MPEDASSPGRNYMPANTQAIIDCAVGTVEPHELDPGEFVGVMIPAGATHRVLDLETHLDRPRRKRGAVALHTGASLVDYVNRHKTDAAVLYADIDSVSVVAVINDHSEAGPGWSDHRATMTLRRTVAWKRWKARNGTIGDQVAFAEHIEDCQLDIVQPSGAEMLELAQSFKATTEARFGSSHMLTSGQRQIEYCEVVAAQAGRSGQLVIPDTFTIGVQPFEGSERYKVACRLRYRVAQGKMAIGFILERPEDVERAAFDGVLAVTRDNTEVLCLFGTPPAIS